MSAPSSGVAETCALVEQLSLLLTSVRAYGVDHPSTERAAAAVAEAVTDAAPPFALQFMVSAVFRDRELLPLDGDRYDRAMSIAEALHRGGAQEIAFTSEASAEEIAILGGALLTAGAKPPRAKETRGPKPAAGVVDFDALGLSTITFREIPDAQPGAELETVEKEIFVSAQLVLALRAARRAITAASGEELLWPFSAGMETIRRLERALETHPAFTASMLEIAPGAIDVARRALNAAHHVAAIASVLETPRTTARAAMHATLILAAVGLGARDGVPFKTAAGVARDAAAAALEGTPFDPHRYAVTAILADLASERTLATTELYGLAYMLERRRCPPDVAFDLTLPDLLSNEIAKLGTDQDRAGSPAAMWLRLRITAAGAIPAGARVRLADGRRAIVLGPGPAGDPMLPSVLVEGRREDVTAPPRLEGTPGAAVRPKTKSLRPHRTRTPTPRPAAPTATPAPIPAKPAAPPPRSATPKPAPVAPPPPPRSATPKPAPVAPPPRSATPKPAPVAPPPRSATPKPAPPLPPRSATPKPAPRGARTDPPKPPAPPTERRATPPPTREVPSPRASQRGSTKGRPSTAPERASTRPGRRTSEVPRRASEVPRRASEVPRRTSESPKRASESLRSLKHASESPRRAATRPDVRAPARPVAPAPEAQPRDPRSADPRRRPIVPREDESEVAAERVEVLAARKPDAPATTKRESPGARGASPRGLVAREDVSTRRGRHDPRSEDEDDR